MKRPSAPEGIRAMSRVLLAAAVVWLSAFSTMAEEKAPTITGGGVLGVKKGDTLLQVVQKLRDCDLRLRLDESEGLPGVAVLARCGVILTMQMDLDPDSGTVFNLLALGGSAATAKGVRVGDTVAKAVRLYGTPRVVTGEGRVCVTFAEPRDLSFCLRNQDAAVFVKRRERATAPSEAPPEGRIGSIIIVGDGT